MTNKIILREYETLGYRAGGCDHVIAQADWEEIRRYLQTNRHDKQVMEIRNETIRAINYVGVLQTSRGTAIEILPKLDIGDLGKLSDDGANESREREIFLRMLRHWRDGPCRSFDRTDVRAAKNFPLLEAFIAMFLKDMHELTRRGLACAYHAVEENRHYLKGKLLIAPHVRHNLAQAQRFYVRYEEFSPNRPINRLLKSTLKFLVRETRNQTNLARIRQALFYFEEIPHSTDIDSDFTRARVDRTMPLYNRLFAWARLFLKRSAPTTWHDTTPALALLFPMEKIFEDYVAHLVRVAMTDCEVKVQESPHYLMNKNPRGEKEFRLRPDIVVRGGGRILIMDVKWKRLNNDRDNHYGIHQTDLYQLFAYGKKYAHADNTGGDVRLFLLYPSNAKFRTVIEFEYESGLPLTALPIKLAVDKKESVDNLRELFGVEQVAKVA